MHDIIAVLALLAFLGATFLAINAHRIAYWLRGRRPLDQDGEEEEIRRAALAGQGLSIEELALRRARKLAMPKALRQHYARYGANTDVSSRALTPGEEKQVGGGFTHGTHHMPAPCEHSSRHATFPFHLERH